MATLNPVQSLASLLIQADAKFLYTLVFMPQKPDSNYIIMSAPYIGIFADGTEQWGRKVGIYPPQFSDKEKQYYSALRNAHKIFETDYNCFRHMLKAALDRSDSHFSKFGTNGRKYYNIGTDVYEEH